MGYFVHEIRSKRIQGYYKTESAAKAQVTRHNKMIDKADGMYIRGFSSRAKWAHCSYMAYEGILQGMNDSQWVMWRFFQQGRDNNTSCP